MRYCIDFKQAEPNLHNQFGLPHFFFLIPKVILTKKNAGKNFEFWIIKFRSHLKLILAFGFYNLEVLEVKINF